MKVEKNTYICKLNLRECCKVLAKCKKQIKY